MFKHVNKNMAAFLCQEWEDFVLYNSKVLICGDREGLGRDTQGFLRGAFARISLIAGMSQLSWGKLLFMTRHFSCLHLLVQSPLIWAAKEWPDSAGRNAPGNTEEEAVWLTNVRNWYYLAFSSPDYEKQTVVQQLTTPFLVISEKWPAALEVVVSKVMSSGTFCAWKRSCECILLESSGFKLVFCGSL